MWLAHLDLTEVHCFAALKLILLVPQPGICTLYHKNGNGGRVSPALQGLGGAFGCRIVLKSFLYAMLWVSRDCPINTAGIQVSMMQHQRILVCSIHITPFAACLYHSSCYCWHADCHNPRPSTRSWSRLYVQSIRETHFH